jgi:fatty acid desaturase
MSEQTVPCPEALKHLRPTDRHGAAHVAMAAGLTTVAIWLSADGGWIRWAIGQALLGLVLVQWFAILHECGHRTMFRGRQLNAFVGHVAGFLSMIPFRSWTKVHGRHHKWTGWQDLDPTTQKLVDRKLSRFQRALVNTCWRLWIPLFSTRYRLDNYWDLRRLARMFPHADEIAPMRTNAVLLALAYVALVAAAGPLAMLRLAAAGIVLSLMIEDLLLLSQHTHLPQNVSQGDRVAPVPAVEQDVFTRSLRLPAWASALLLNFDAHELHHMYPFVPGHHLRRIPYRPEHEVPWHEWVRSSKRVGGVTLLFENSRSTGIEI